MITRKDKFRIGKDVKCKRRSIDLDIENFAEVSKALLINDSGSSRDQWWQETKEQVLLLGLTQLKSRRDTQVRFKQPRVRCWVQVQTLAKGAVKEKTILDLQNKMT